MLNFIPCNDVCGENGTKDTGRVVTISTSDEHPCSGVVDLCSPFCHCACCAGFSIIKNKVEIVLKPYFQFKHSYASCIPSEVIEISLPVWQPPQLA